MKSAMRYFISSGQRQGTCYHEFFAGKWDGKSFWDEDSILIHDDLLCEGFARALLQAAPGWSAFGVSEISREQWEKIGTLIGNEDETAREIYQEADEWAQGVFAKADRFTILGI